MSILSLTRAEVVAFAQDGLMKKESVRHWDICKALKDKVPQEKIAEIFNLTDSKQVRWVKSKKCPDCYR